MDLSGRAVHIVVDLGAGDDDGDRLDQRPVGGVRARELGLLDMSAFAGGAMSTPRDLAIALGKASTLIEALPWLERFHGSTVVVSSTAGTR